MNEQGTGTAPGSSALAALSDALADAVAQAGRSIARVDGRHRQPASGIVWSSDGLIVTADHVVERDDDLQVGLPDGRTVRARLVGRDPGSDLALLKAEAEGLTPLARGAMPRVGGLSLIVARPGPELMASLGTISAVSGPIRTRRGGRLDGLIATDATFYPGFSGAPLIAASGQARRAGNVTVPRRAWQRRGDPDGDGRADGGSAERPWPSAPWLRRHRKPAGPAT